MERILLGFARALREAGVPVTADRARGYLRAAALVGLENRFGVYVAGRATLCGTPTDLARHDAVFAAWFGSGAEPLTMPGPARPTVSRSELAMLTDPVDSGPAAGDGDPLRVAASGAEILRHRDIAALTDAEHAVVAELVRRLPLRPPLRYTARLRPARRGRVDTARTLRATLRRFGEPAPIAWRHRGRRPRRVVLLIDVSGSMRPYADVLLRLAHRMSRGTRSVETFTVGTRLTHLTRALAERDTERALAAVSGVVPDWAGGTRLGETLAVFVRRYRALARGAVVVVFSDGWERGDPARLGEQMAVVHRLAHRVVWVNPHRGKPGYQPVQGGILAVLDHVDDLVAGHSVAAYTRLAEVIGGA